MGKGFSSASSSSVQQQQTSVSSSLEVLLEWKNHPVPHLPMPLAPKTSKSEVTQMPQTFEDFATCYRVHSFIFSFRKHLLSVYSSCVSDRGIIKEVTERV